MWPLGSCFRPDLNVQCTAPRSKSLEMPLNKDAEATPSRGSRGEELALKREDACERQGSRSQQGGAQQEQAKVPHIPHKTYLSSI